MPDDPVAFSIRFLSEKVPAPVPAEDEDEDQDMLGSASDDVDADALRGAELPSVRDEVDAEMGDRRYQARRRRNVFVAAPTPGQITAPVVEKDEETTQMIMASIANNKLSKHLDSDQRAELAKYFSRLSKVEGDVIIRQGDKGDFFYVLETGSCTVFKSVAGAEETQVGTMPAGSSFGELALIYNAPRAATVVAAEPCVLWAIDGAMYRQVVLDSIRCRRQMHLEFLHNVQILSPLSDGQISAIADALMPCEYGDGQVIITQGDIGDRFYFVEKGRVDVYVRPQDQPADENQWGKKVATLGEKEHFGETAIISDAPRNATVVAKGDCKLMSLDRDAFQRLLGDIGTVLKRPEPIPEAQ
jgi:cAMP-dependent protein kinase regulator|eukprot:gnl/Ergobibamus_cyprinoides/1154.p1 GENE.gnl/Ergobibamus_cyprinoides/1154~~gnl/Ergobibamus_cyprinoides/1154.p1  ORF type:complete len:398 (+),score=168.15 gnl/Ergobibamus_cyprinoides/1154:122-1195(+)